MSYLTRGERSNFLTALGVHEVLARWADDGKNHLTAEEKKYLRMGATFIKKACKSLIERLEPDYRERLMSDSKNNFLAIVPTRTTTAPEESRVKTDTLYDLGAFALLHCQAKEDCFSGNNWKGCELYKILMELDMPVANFDGGRCPYKL